MDFNLFGNDGESKADAPKVHSKAAQGDKEVTPDAEYEDWLRDNLAALLGDGGETLFSMSGDTPALWPRTVTGRAVMGRMGLGVMLSGYPQVVFGTAQDAVMPNAKWKMDVGTKGRDALSLRYGSKHRVPVRNEDGEYAYGTNGPIYQEVETDPKSVLTDLYAIPADKMEHAPAWPKALDLNAAAGALNNAAIRYLATYAERSVDAVLKAAGPKAQLLRISKADPSRLHINAPEATLGAICLATARWLLPKSYRTQYQRGLERGKGEPSGWYKTADLPPPHRLAFELRLLAVALGILYAGHVPALGATDEAWAAFADNACNGGNIGRISVSCRKVGDALHGFDRSVWQSAFAQGINEYTGLSESAQANAEEGEDIGALLDKAGGEKEIPL